VKNVNDSQPIFQQIIETIERDIITGVYTTDDLIISTTQISRVYSVNPTTAVKAISKMTDAGILYKKRGIGMCVAQGACEKITARRKKVFLNQTMDAFIAESETLGLSTDELIHEIKNKKGVKRHD
jgi:DNA-binding transcriptional regulator YhcF (GntR family)